MEFIIIMELLYKCGVARWRPCGKHLRRSFLAEMKSLVLFNYQTLVCVFINEFSGVCAVLNACIKSRKWVT